MKRWALVAVSAGQLACGVWGQYVAVRDEHPYDVPLKGRGSPDRIVQDSWLQGTALSAPVFMLAGQAAATVRLAAGPSVWASRTLGILGACMVGGYLMEREEALGGDPRGLRPVRHSGGRRRVGARGPDGCSGPERSIQPSDTWNADAGCRAWS